MTLLLIGMNHKTAPIELRECLYLRSNILKNVLKQLQKTTEYIEEVIILSTCNRFEVYARATDLELACQEIINFMCEHYDIDAIDLTASLYIQRDEDVTQHVMRVSAGLDSMVLGESQILGQVTNALQSASAMKTTGAYLHRLFESAIHAGKRARTETRISQQTTSISHAAALLMKEKIAVPDPKVIILGADEMAELALNAIHRFGLSHIALINRTYEKAQTIAHKFGVKAYVWSDLQSHLLDTDAVITATGAEQPVLYYDDLDTVMQERRNHQLLLIDIAMPRNIDPASKNIEGIDLFDIDALKDIVDDSLLARQACIPEVQMIIEQEKARYLDWTKERAIVPVIKDLRREVAGMVKLEVEFALKKMTDMSDTDLDIVKRMAHRITNKILHTPTKNLRLHASDSDAEIYATVLTELFALNTNDEQL